MVLSATREHGLSLILIEGCLTAIAFAVAFCWPRIGSAWFSRVEHAFSNLARRKTLSVAVVGLAALLLRLAILPICPIPQPFIHDEFSFLLAADTFASGRLTNPTPAMWVHFESFHITMRPTYMSMYFPAQGLVLAAGKVLVGHPWFGLLIVTALMCSAICWMLQAWLPPTWALLGGILAVLRLGLFSYWIDTYAGAGSIAALGGALVLGALPRFTRGVRLRDGLLLAAGVVLLGTCRLYEGMLLCLPVAFVLVRWVFFGNNRPALHVLFHSAAVPLTLIIVGAAWMGYYNYRVFGSPTALPYTVNHAQYGIAPFFLWQSQLPEPAYRHKEMREFYTHDEFSIFKELHPLSGFVPKTFLKAARGILFYAGIALLVPFMMVRRVTLDRRHRFLILCVLVVMAGQLGETFFFPHYLAPFTAAFYAIGLQAMRHLRLWSPGNQPVGMALVRLTVTLCVVLAGLRLYAEPLHLKLSPAYANEWYGRRFESGTERAKIAADFAKQPEKALVIVRYSPDHNSLDEWVYNAADVDNSKVIWAREMDDAENFELIHYYKDRTVWLVQPDSKPASVSLYLSASGQPVNVSR
jgi:hypothetical protein